MASSGGAMITLLLVCGLLNCAAVTVYNVGGDAGWTLLTSADSPSYDSQFAGIHLQSGDGLNFTFAEGAHNVVSSLPGNTAVDCNSSIPLYANTYNTSVTIYLTTTRPQGASFPFICSFPNHCSEYGMHLTVTVGGPSAEAPDSSPTESPSSPPAL